MANTGGLSSRFMLVEGGISALNQPQYCAGGREFQLGRYAGRW